MVQYMKKTSRSFYSNLQHSFENILTIEIAAVISPYIYNSFLFLNLLTIKYKPI